MFKNFLIAINLWNTIHVKTALQWIRKTSPSFVSFIQPKLIFCPHQPSSLKELAIPTFFLISPILLFTAIRLPSPFTWIEPLSHAPKNSTLATWNIRRIHFDSLSIAISFRSLSKYNSSTSQSPIYSFNVLRPHIHISLPDMVNYRLFKLLTFFKSPSL